MNYKFLRPIIAALCLIACGIGIATTLRAGFARQLSERASTQAELAFADEAVQMVPADPEVRLTRGRILATTGNLSGAIEELKLATELRPSDYRLWSELGRAYEQAGDRQNALVAFREAATRAPFYAQPRWNLGNLLLNMGKPEAAFAELSRAGNSDHNLFPEVVKLAWTTYKGEPHQVEEAVNPQTTETRIELARMLVWRARPREAVAVFRATNGVPLRDRKDFIVDLIRGKWFLEAYEAWSHNREGYGEGVRIGVIDNGSFEETDRFYEDGFGWNLAVKSRAVSFSVDSNVKHTGLRSLLIEWRGNSVPSVPALSQLLLTEPKTKYRLSFAARTEDLITGTPPRLEIFDESSEAKRRLGQPLLIPTGSLAWTDHSIEFSTSDSTKAVSLLLTRDKCNEPACPIFGRLWLDNFLLQKIDR